MTAATEPDKDALIELYLERRITFDELKKELELLDAIEHGERVFFLAAAGIVAFALFVTYFVFLR